MSLSNCQEKNGATAINKKIYALDEIKAIASPVAAKYGIDGLYLFGSYARGSATVESDIDFRVDRGVVRSLFLLGGLYSELEDLFQKQLNIVTTQSLSPEFLERIGPEEVLIYGKTKQ